MLTLSVQKLRQGCRMSKDILKRFLFLAISLKGLITFTKALSILLTQAQVAMATLQAMQIGDKIYIWMRLGLTLFTAHLARFNLLRWRSIFGRGLNEYI